MTADPGRQLAELADEIRAMAVNGLHYSGNPYDTDRYTRLLDAAARLLAVADSRSGAEIMREFRGDLSLRTPNFCADAAVFDDTGRLLMVQRADTAEWCTPGGVSEVGESPSEGAVRECWEETGLKVRALGLIGLYDNRITYGRDPAWHLYNAVVRCEVVGGELTTTNETLAYAWLTEEEAMGRPLFRGYPVKIPDMFRHLRGELAGPVLH